MCRNPIPLRRSARLALFVLLPAVALLASAPRAGAVTVYFQPTGYGISLTSAQTAQANGIPIINVPLTDVFLPDPSDIDQPSHILDSWTNPPGADFSNPATGHNTWTWTNPVGDEPLEDLWIMFRGHASDDPTNPFYSQGNVGLELGSGWGILALSDGIFTEYHPSYFIGRLDPGETKSIPLDYRIAQQLYLNGGGDYVFPKLLIGGAFAVPEPSSLVLLATGLALVAATGRRRC